MSHYQTTPTAVSGTFQSRSGEDHVHYMSEGGDIVCGIDSEGTVFAEDFIPSIGMSLMQLQAFVLSHGFSNFIDGGTF